MTTTPAQATARETLDLNAICVALESATMGDDAEEWCADPDYHVPVYQNAVKALVARGYRIVDAAEDDRRTEALIRHRQFVAALDKLRFDVGPDDVFRYDRVKDLRRALDPYLHDDDTGGEG